MKLDDPAISVPKNVRYGISRNLTLVVAGAGAVALTTLIQIPDGLALVALVFGVTVSTVGVTLGRFSSAHINPAVTVAHCLAGKSSPKLFFPIVLFQVIGGITGGIILSFFFPKSEASNYLGSTLLASTVPPWTGTTLEAAGTFVLSIMILAPLRRLGTKANSTLVGLTLFILIF